MTILICESCEHGYPRGADACIWCGSLAVFAHETAPLTLVCDTECYPDYWLCKFRGENGEAFDFQLCPGHRYDHHALQKLLSKAVIYTFNGNNYDVPMIALAQYLVTEQWPMADRTPEECCRLLKQANDEIIKGNMRPWEFADRWRITIPRWLNHVDLMLVKPGEGSLKMLGGKMHSKRIQDLPYDPSTSLDLFARAVVREYCGNDLDTTDDLRRTMSAQIALREAMSQEYGVDVRSKSDPQIAETVMKKILGFTPEAPYIEPGSTFYYRPPTWMRFIGLPLLELLARSPFTVNASGHVDMTDELANTRIKIGNSTYRMGIGGLHSSESGVLHRADETYSLQDVDVTGYYPSLIINTGIFPPQIGTIFQDIYRGWRDRRVAAKRNGDTKTANSLKTLGNGVFGKFANKYSIFYAPSEMIQVTITGQLSLLMLIEILELSGISVVSANTDGILIRCARSMEWLRDQCVKQWCAQTGFDTETVEYSLMAMRDVNSYIAIGTNGKPKLKGEYAPPEPGPSGWPNPTGQVCVDALVGYLSRGTPLAETIMACADVRRFVHIRHARGGAEWKQGIAHDKAATQKAMRETITALGWREAAGMAKHWVNPATGEILPLADAYASTFNGDEPLYLGRAVRWYYARGYAGHIRYVGSGNKVATTDGCRPLMELPDSLPADIDYEHYLNDARAMLADMGVMQ